MPRSRARRARRRVSSAATTSAVDNVSRSRGDASPTLPSGAPTRTSRPPSVGMAPSLFSTSRSLADRRTANPEVRRSPYARPDAYDRRVSTAAITDAPDLTTVVGDPARVAVPEIVRRRLAPRLPDDRTFAWIGTA